MTRSRSRATAATPLPLPTRSSASRSWRSPSTIQISPIEPRGRRSSRSIARFSWTPPIPSWSGTSSARAPSRSPSSARPRRRSRSSRNRLNARRGTPGRGTSARSCTSAWATPTRQSPVSEPRSSTTILPSRRGCASASSGDLRHLRRRRRDLPPPRSGTCRVDASGGRRAGYAPFVLRELLEARAGEEYDLYARTINPQFIRVLRTIGFDRQWARAEGASLYDADGRRFLDMLGGFGMFAVGRNNPRIRAALVEALELDTPGSVQIGASLLPGLLAEQLLARTPARLERVLFTNSGTEAVEAALKLGRAAAGAGRSRVVSTDHGFHGLTLGSLSAGGGVPLTDRLGPPPSGGSCGP